MRSLETLLSSTCSPRKLPPRPAAGQPRMWLGQPELGGKSVGRGRITVGLPCQFRLTKSKLSV